MTQGVEISPFTAEHLDTVAALLEERQRGLRAVRPELSEAFTHVARCQPLLAALLGHDG